MQCFASVFVFLYFELCDCWCVGVTRVQTRLSRQA